VAACNDCGVPRLLTKVVCTGERSRYHRQVACNFGPFLAGTPPYKGYLGLLVARRVERRGLHCQSATFHGGVQPLQVPGCINLTLGMPSVDRQTQR